MQTSQSNMVFQYINIFQIPWELLKTSIFNTGFQQLLCDLANVNVKKTMFDPYNEIQGSIFLKGQKADDKFYDCKL